MKPLVAIAVVLSYTTSWSLAQQLDLREVERARVISRADSYLNEEPVTVTASVSDRSAGGRYDYYSEGDYWWPDPENPAGPYIRRDGLSNPDVFLDHRRALRRLSLIVPALAAAYRLTGECRYAHHAMSHLRAWFADDSTRMNPHLLYGQAISGHVTGRGIGIIDTIHLVEVARSLPIVERCPSAGGADRIRGWFADYLAWLTTHPFGIDERDNANNHSTWWAVQVAQFADLTENDELLAYVRRFLKETVIPGQIEPDGSMPRELGRTKPYAYMLFNLDGLAAAAQILSTPEDDLWQFETADGRGIRRAVAFAYPYLADKSSWPYSPDIVDFDEWPIRHPSLFFSGIAFGEQRYLDLWKTLEPDPTNEETIRNYPIRQPILWMEAGDSPLRIASPRGHVEMEVQSGGELRYRVAMAGEPVLEDSRLGIIVDGIDLGIGSDLVETVRYHRDEPFDSRGVHSAAADRSNGALLSLRHAATGTDYMVDVRVFDDGIAFRHVVPGQGWRVPEEATSFVLPAGSTTWYHDFNGHYEGSHSKKSVDEVEAGEWAAPPLTFTLPGGRGYGSITEAALFNYSGLGLQAGGGRSFSARLAHAHPPSYPFVLRYGEEEAVRLAKPAAVRGTVTTPWRVVLAAPDLNTLVNSDIILSVSPPPDPDLFPDGLATAWLRPGRSVWQYLDGGERTLEEMKAFSRMAGELGFEYNLIEGFWQRWSEDELRELVDYSKQHGVGIWLWKHSRDLRTPKARRDFFAGIRNAGAVGAKVDFFDHEAREIIDVYYDLLREAAAHQIMLNFHGANKPSGESRTWPNEMNREGISGMERRSMEAWSRHNATLPFTRMLAGHADFTPMLFGERRRETSWAHQIASAAILSAPVLVYGAHPQSILENPAVEVIKAIPSVWDETLVLPMSEIGEVAAFARRGGSEWFVAVMNGPDARSIHVPLDFLAAGSYRVELARDDPDEAAAVRVEEISVTADDVLPIHLRPGGGFVATFRPTVNP